MCWDLWESGILYWLGLLSQKEINLVLPVVVLAQEGRACLGRKPTEKEAEPRGGGRTPAIQGA